MTTTTIDATGTYTETISLTDDLLITRDSATPDGDPVIAVLKITAAVGGTVTISNGATAKLTALTVSVLPSFDIGDNGTLEIANTISVSLGNSISFTGTGGTLRIDDGVTISLLGAIQNFGTGDTIDLAAISGAVSTSASYSGGNTTVTFYNASGTSIGTVKLSGNYTSGSNQFATAIDGSGTDLTWGPPMAPSLGSIPPSQTVTDTGTLQPFASVNVGDTNTTAPVSATITLSTAGIATDADGTLSGTGLVKTGTGIYQIAATDLSDLNDDLHSVVFTPVDSGSSYVTKFSLAVTNDGTTTVGSTTAVTNSAPCYLAGTNILTDRGEVAVELLAIGDRLVTLSGEARPIKWIGKRRYDGLLTLANPRVQPILVRRDALATGVPRRDLYVSADHALYLRDTLIPAGLLVNGASIVQADGIDPVQYFHLELDEHAIIFAEGAAAESFVDCDSRLLFENAAEFAALYRDDASPSWAFCAPRVEAGFTLTLVRQDLAQRAGLPTPQPFETPQSGPLAGNLDLVTRELLSGWAFQSEHPDTPVHLEVLDGEALVMRLVANAFRVDLHTAGYGTGRAAFNVRLPRPLTTDRDHEIHVRRAADGTELPNSPYTLSAATSPEITRAALARTIRDSVLSAATAEDLDGLLSDLTDKAALVREARALRVGAGPAASGRKRALVIDDRLPDATRDAASVAILSHMRALQRAGFAVEFAASQSFGAPPAPVETAALADLGVVIHGAPAIFSVEEALSRAKGDYDLIYLHRLTNAEAYAALARRHHPSSRLLFSVADLHSLRESRRALVQERPEILAESKRLRDRELRTLQLVDAVITHAAYEAQMLMQAAPRVQINVVGWDVPVTGYDRDIANRQGVAFVGHYDHAPNIDAANWLVTTIMPLVWRQDPTIECLLAGSAMPPGFARWAEREPRIKAVGHVAKLSDLFDRVRLTVAPLTYGAGIKGKVLASFAAGVPCVMTGVAAEGIPIPPALEGLIGQTAEQIAETICRLYRDTEAHGVCATAGRAMIRAHFSETRVDQAMRAALIDGPAQPRRPAASVTLLSRAS